MLIILIAIIIAAIFIVFAFRSSDTANSVGLIWMAIIVFIGGLIGGIFIPTEYEEWEVYNTTEIVTLSNSTVTEGGGFLYVSVSGENVYTYRYEIDSTATITDYKTDTISGNVVEREDINCKVPELIEERRKGKVTIWSFGLIPDTRYVFHVPYGTISHEVKLK